MRLRRAAAAGILLFILLFSGSVVWIFFTPSGAQFVLDSISRYTSLKILANSVEGRLAWGLSLSGLEIRSSELRVTVQKATFTLSPPSLLFGHIALNKVAVTGVEVFDGRPQDQPLNLKWPHVTGVLAYIQGDVNGLLIKDLQYQAKSGTKVSMDSFSAGLSWRRGVFALHDVAIVIHGSRATGQIEAGFRTPFLRVSLQAMTRERQTGFDGVKLKAELRNTGGAAQLEGTIVAAMLTGNDEQLHLEATLTLLQDGLNLRSATFTRPGEKGHLAVVGGVNIVQGAPSFSVRVTMEDFSLEQWIGTPVVLKGELDATGTDKDFVGNFTMRNRTEGWRAARAEGRISGDRSHITLETVKGEWLGGSLSGEGQINWETGLRIAGKVRARHLDPGRVDGTWSGDLNGDAFFRAVFPREGGTEAAIDAKLLQSTFRGHPVRGVIEAEMQGESLRLTQLDLHGKGIDISAGGGLTKGIEFQVNVGDLSALFPRSRGRLTVTGNVRRNEHGLTGHLVSSGNDFSYETLSVGKLKVEGRLEQGSGQGASIKADALKVAYGTHSANSVNIEIAGTMARHDISLTLTTPQTRSESMLSGSYEKGLWEGMISKLQGSDKSRGAWSLASATPLKISRKHLFLAPLEVGRTTGESLTLSTDLDLKPLVGFVRVGWRKFDLSQISPFIPADVKGESGGSLIARFNGNDLSQFEVETSLSAAVRYREAGIMISKGDFSARWTQSGLSAVWSTLLNGDGTLRGTISSPDKPRLGAPRTGDASVSWEHVDLARFMPLFARTVQVEGSTSGKLEAKLDSDDRFIMRVHAETRNGAVHTVSNGNTIRVPFRLVSVDGDWKEKDLSGRVLVEADQKGALKAAFSLPIPARFPLKIRNDGPLRVAVKGRELDAAMAAPFIRDYARGLYGSTELSFDTEGTWEQPRTKARLSMEGGAYLPRADLRLQGLKVLGTFSWDEDGLRASLDGNLGKRGNLVLNAVSHERPRVGLPGQSAITGEWNGLDLSLAASLLPPDTQIEGETSGSLKGDLLPNARVRAELLTTVSGARLTFLDKKKGTVSVSLKSARIKATWQDDKVSGDGLADFTEYGRMQASFVLPIPARFPVHPVSTGAIKVAVQGKLREQGIVSALLPGLAQETQGQVSFDIVMKGTWSHPQFRGNSRLSDAAAYLPVAGIKIKNMTAQLEISEDAIQLVSFKAESGPGSVEGSGTLWLKDWSIAHYKGKLTGTGFQAVLRPDLRIVANPDLHFEGTGKELSVEGEVKIPELGIYGPPVENIVRESADAIIMGKGERKEQKSSMKIKAAVKVILGEKVTVKMQGIDAGLEGSVLLKATGLDDLTANGQIRIVKGSYATRGVKLTISRGSLLFAGPVEMATLDVIAVRQVKDVTAGVQVLGTVSKPRINMYSNPQLPDADILSYVVFGQPLAGGVGQTTLLMTAAGALLSREGSNSFSDKLKKTLGLETLDVQTGQGDLQSAMVTVGKYLSPKLYVSFGRSIISDDYAITARYRLSKKWEVETSTSSEKRGTIYYKIQFD